MNQKQTHCLVTHFDENIFRVDFVGDYLACKCNLKDNQILYSVSYDVDIATACRSFVQNTILVKACAMYSATYDIFVRGRRIIHDLHEPFTHGDVSEVDKEMILEKIFKDIRKTFTGDFA